LEKAQSIARKIVNGVLGGGGFTITSIVTNVVLISFVMDFLPKDISGLWFLFISFGLYIAFFDLGFSPTISREIGFILGSTMLSEEEKAQGVRDIIATSLRVFQVTSVLVFVLALTAGGAFVLSLAPEGSITEVGIAWGIFSFGAAVNILGGAAFATLYGLGYVATERIVRSIGLWLWLLLSVASLYMGFGIVGLSVAWVTQNLLARAIGWVLIYRYNPELRHKKGRVGMDIFKKMAMPSIKWAAIGLGALFILQSDNPIIAAIFGPEAIPPYEAASKMVIAMMTFSLLVVTSSTPFVSRAWSAGNVEGVRSLLIRNVRYGMSIMVVFVAYLAVFGEMVVDLWLGPGNFVGYPVLWTLLAVLTFEAHHVIHASAAMGAGHIVFLRAALLSGILKIGLSVMLARYYGLLGVAMGTLIAQLLTNNWYAPFVALRLFEVRFTDYLKTCVLPLMLLLGLMVFLNAWMRDLLFNGSLLMVVLKSLSLSCFIGGLVFWFLLISKEERGKIVTLVRPDRGGADV